jgi:hypothetical protein
VRVINELRPGLPDWITEATLKLRVGSKSNTPLRKAMAPFTRSTTPFAWRCAALDDWTPYA